MHKFIISLCFLAFSFSQTEMSHKEKIIRSYLKLSGKTEATLQGLDQTITTLKSLRKHVPDDFWETFKADLIKDGLTINSELVKIYASYFTVDELEALNAFYLSNTGKKLGKLYEKLSNESILAGREWGKKLGARLEEELKKKGF